MQKIYTKSLVMYIKPSDGRVTMIRTAKQNCSNFYLSEIRMLSVKQNCTNFYLSEIRMLSVKHSTSESAYPNYQSNPLFLL